MSLFSFQASSPWWSFKHVYSILAALECPTLQELKTDPNLRLSYSRVLPESMGLITLRPNLVQIHYKVLPCFPMLNRDQWDTVGTGSSKCGRKIRSKWREISPAGVGVKLSSFVIQMPKFASMALLSQQLLPKWSSQKEA